MLDKTSRKILQKIIKSGTINEFELRKNITTPKDALGYVVTIDFLKREKYILTGNAQTAQGLCAAYTATPLGKRAYEDYNREMRFARMTLIFSAIGALSGIAGVVISFIALAMKLP